MDPVSDALIFAEIDLAREFNAALAVWDAMQNQFDEAVKESWEYEEIRRQLDAAQREHKAAESELKAREPIEIVRSGAGK